MEAKVRQWLNDLASPDREVQGAAYRPLMDAAAARPAAWAYQAWDEIVRGLASRDNRLRSISAQLLSRLAATSDPEARILKDLDALAAVTRDEKFVTARHALQAIWQVGTAGPKQKARLVAALAARFADCAAEKNGTLVRYDVLASLRSLYDSAPDEQLRDLARELIESEPDSKYRRKYATLWK